MSRITVSRVYRITDGSPLLEDITDSVPATGGRLKVEAVTDFDPADDGEVRYAVIDAEHISFTDVDEDTDELVNITRGANSTVAAAHTAGTFVQAGLVAKSEKFADGFIDDDEALAQGVEIMRHLWRMYPVGDRDHDEMEIATLRYLDDDHPIIIDAPEDDRVDAPRFFTWSRTGTIAVSTRPHRWPAPFGGHLKEFFMTLGEGGEADDDVIVDILNDGVSILTEKIVVPAGEWLSNVAVPTTQEIRKFDALQVQFEQVGVTDKGANPTIIGVLYPSEAVTAGRIEVQGPQGVPGADGADGADGSDGLISEVRDDGTPVTDAGIMDFTGAGVTVTSDGSVITVAIPGGGTGNVGKGAKGYRNSAQSVAHNTFTSQQLDTEDYDDAGIFNPATGVFTDPGWGGKWLVLHKVGWSNNTTGVRQLVGERINTTLGGNNTYQVVPEIIKVSAGAVITSGGTLYQTSGGSLNTVIEAPNGNSVHVVYLGA